MTSFGNLLVRLLTIAFGLFLAFAAAGIFVSFGMFGGFFNDILLDFEDFSQGEFQATGGLTAALVVLAGFLTSPFLMGSALLPAAITIAMAELMRWRGMTVNIVLGGLVALFAGLTSHGGPVSEGTVVVLLAAGFIGGFFYWLGAGRGAGNWLVRPPSPRNNSR